MPKVFFGAIRPDPGSKGAGDRRGKEGVKK